MFRKLLAVWVLVLLAMWILPDLSNLQAGKKYYYDTNGNLVSEEEYRKLVDQMRAPDRKTPRKKEDTETVESPVEKNTQNPEKQAVENETVAEKPIEGEAEDVEKKAEAEDDEENDFEAEDTEVHYQAEVSSETIFRVFERDTVKSSDGNKENNDLVTAAYQYLRLDLGALDEAGLSLHIHGWGRQDFNDSHFYDSNPDGELLYGYLEYNQPDYGLNLKLGRQHIMTGVINNSIDGIGLKSALTSYFKFSAYGGSPVDLSEKEGRSGDSIWGGRIAGHRGADFEAGLSYKKKKSDGNDDEELAGVDLFAVLPLNINFFGFSSYNLDTSGFGEHSYDIRFDIFDFNFRPFYQRFRYEDFFNTKDNSANPFRFLAETEEILSVVGTDATYSGFTSLALGAKINYYDYDKRDDNSLYVEGNAAWYFNGLTQLGGQLGRMNGDSSETKYFLSRGFFYWDDPNKLLWLAFLSGDIMYVHYDEEIYDQDYSFWVSLGGGWRFWDDTLEIKLSGDWSDDPFFDSDLRGMLKIQYTY
jgi:hypothetical protein